MDHQHIARQHAQGFHHEPMDEKAIQRERDIQVNSSQALLQRTEEAIAYRRQEIQAKKEAEAKAQSGLEINDPGDHHEKEADAVAEKVVSGEGAEVSSAVTSKLSKKEEVQCKEEEGALMAKSEDGRLKASGELQATLDSSKGSGQSLDDRTKAEMEEKMNADLSDIRIHTGNEAHDTAEGINAKAFTHGQDIYFKNGKYDPNSKEGKTLLAHELAHTQQQKGGVKRKIQRAEADTRLGRDKVKESSNDINSYVNEALSKMRQIYKPYPAKTFAEIAPWYLYLMIASSIREKSHR
jgi:hypothetical protein